MTQTATYNRAVSAHLADMPDRIFRLPISPTGYPVPWFVSWYKDGQPCPTGEGEPDFRVADQAKMGKAIAHRFCFTCGGPLGVFKAFPIGPMCCVTRSISEPPSHRECAVWSARVCPFLSKPRMVRNEKDLPGGTVAAAGLGLKRNPGAVAVWITKTYKPFRALHGNSGILFKIGKPVEVLWFAEGREATRAEVMASIDSGFPELEKSARAEGPGAMTALRQMRDEALALVPAE